MSKVASWISAPNAQIARRWARPVCCCSLLIKGGFFFLGDGDKRKHAISEVFLFLKAVKRDVGRKGGGG